MCDMYHYLNMKVPILAYDTLYYIGQPNHHYKEYTFWAQLCNVKTLMLCNYNGTSYNYRKIFSPC